jgi:hypothetical protein
MRISSVAAGALDDNKCFMFMAVFLSARRLGFSV